MNVHVSMNNVLFVLGWTSEHGLRVNQLEVHVKRDRERNNAMWYVCNFYVFLDYTRDKLSEQRMVELARSVQELLPEPMTKVCTARWGRE